MDKLTKESFDEIRLKVSQAYRLRDSIEELKNLLSTQSIFLPPAPLIRELDTFLLRDLKALKSLSETFESMEIQCQHPSWVDDGWDSHHNYEKCSVCGKSRKC